MKGPLFYSKILLFGEYGIIQDSKGLSIPYNFYNGALKMDENSSDSAMKSNESIYDSEACEVPRVSENIRKSSLSISY
jgi:hypothetical protein